MSAFGIYLWRIPTEAVWKLGFSSTREAGSMAIFRHVARAGF
jgi:hypothetical protein